MASLRRVVATGTLEVNSAFRWPAAGHRDSCCMVRGHGAHREWRSGMSASSAGARFRAAVARERPLQVSAAFTLRRAYGGACRLQGDLPLGAACRGLAGLPDLASRRWMMSSRTCAASRRDPAPAARRRRYRFGARSTSRERRSLDRVRRRRHAHRRSGAAKRCGHRPGKAIVTGGDGRTASRRGRREDRPRIRHHGPTDALAVEGLDSAIDRVAACVEAGADWSFRKRSPSSSTYRRFADAAGSRSSPTSRSSV